MTNSIKIATAYNLITPDVRQNGENVRDLMMSARAAGARLIHFPEGALSGYAKSEIATWEHVDWHALRGELDEVAALAKRIGLWTVIGCNHRLSPPNRPHNSLYIISKDGCLVSRYDKRLCSHSELNGWYSPGDMPVVFDVDGIRFGAAICIELQFPELFLEYARLGVDCVLFSAYSGDPMYGIEAQAHAALNNYWLSLSTPAQCNDKLPSGLIGPDGYYLAKGSSDLKAGFTCGEINRGDARYAIALNKARPWRAAVRAGDLYTPHHVHDERSNDRTSF